MRGTRILAVFFFPIYSRDIVDPRPHVSGQSALRGNRSEH
jgi:hypothetical protein